MPLDRRHGQCISSRLVAVKTHGRSPRTVSHYALPGVVPYSGLPEVSSQSDILSLTVLSWPVLETVSDAKRKRMARRGFLLVFVFQVPFNFSIDGSPPHNCFGNADLKRYSEYIPD
jgi:hypothetical protein